MCFRGSLPLREGPLNSDQPSYDRKSNVDAIRARFDADVERFSNLETGQSATIDAPLAMQLIAEAAETTTPSARHLLDIGCGAVTIRSNFSNA